MLYVQTIEQWAWVMFGAYLLLTAVCACFYFLPNTVPDSFRRVPSGNHRSFSERFLHFVQGYDQNTNNACPSAHCVFAVYLTVVSGGAEFWGPLIWFFPIIIAFSCLFTKQHVAIDTIVGSVFGAIGGYGVIAYMPRY
jgi:membrane-associated phospholipid phosphatase